MRSLSLAATAAALALTASVAACGSDDSTDAVATTTTVAAAADDSSSTTVAPAGDATTVNANDASVDELASAFDAAGVANADRWAREVDEYRPYSGTDDWAKLKQELSKYNIDDDTLERILSVLEV